MQFTAVHAPGTSFQPWDVKMPSINQSINQSVGVLFIFWDLQPASLTPATMAIPLNQIMSEISLARQTSVEVKSELLHGYSNVVYELRAGNNERWCLRVPVDLAAARTAVRGTRILEAIKEKCPSLRAPAVILSSEQYTVLEYLSGNPLGSWNKSVLVKKQRHLLLDHFANFLYCLWGADLRSLKNSG